MNPANKPIIDQANLNIEESGNTHNTNTQEQINSESYQIVKSFNNDSDYNMPRRNASINIPKIKSMDSLPENLNNGEGQNGFCINTPKSMMEIEKIQSNKQNSISKILGDNNLNSLAGPLMTFFKNIAPLVPQANTNDNGNKGVQDLNKTSPIILKPKYKPIKPSQEITELDKFKSSKIIRFNNLNPTTPVISQGIMKKCRTVQNLDIKNQQSEKNNNTVNQSNQQNTHSSFIFKKIGSLSPVKRSNLQINKCPSININKVPQEINHQQEQNYYPKDHNCPPGNVNLKMFYNDEEENDDDQDDEQKQMLTTNRLCSLDNLDNEDSFSKFQKPKIKTRTGGIIKLKDPQSNLLNTSTNNNSNIKNFRIVATNDISNSKTDIKIHRRTQSMNEVNKLASPSKKTHIMEVVVSQTNNNEFINKNDIVQNKPEIPDRNVNNFFMCKSKSSSHLKKNNILQNNEKKEIISKPGGSYMPDLIRKKCSTGLGPEAGKEETEKKRLSQSMGYFRSFARKNTATSNMKINNHKKLNVSQGNIVDEYDEAGDKYHDNDNNSVANIRQPSSSTNISNNNNKMFKGRYFCPTKVEREKNLVNSIGFTNQTSDFLNKMDSILNAPKLNVKLVKDDIEKDLKNREMKREIEIKQMIDDSANYARKKANKEKKS